MWDEIKSYFEMYSLYYYKVKRTYKQHIKPFFYLQNYKRFFKWIPVIWNDREWDYYFLFQLLKHKLKKDSKYFEKHGIGANNKKIAREMRLCINLIDRIIKDDYCSDMLDKIDEKYGKFILVPTNKVGYTSLTREKLKDNEELHEKYRKDTKKMVAHADYLREQDKEFLFDLLKKNIFHWWD